MKKQDFKIVLLRAFAHRLRSFADFVLTHTEEEEHAEPEDDSTNQDADEISVSWLTTIEADAPPAHWLERVRQGVPSLPDTFSGDPVREAPRICRDGMVKLYPTDPTRMQSRPANPTTMQQLQEWLVQRASPHQQASLLNVPNLPVDIPKHNSELLPAEIADTTLHAKNQHIQSGKPHDQYGQIDSAHSRAPFSEPMKEHKKEQEEEVSLSGKNRVGAAWSAYHLPVYHTLTARKPAPISPTTLLADGVGQGVDPLPISPISPSTMRADEVGQGFIPRRSPISPTMMRADAAGQRTQPRSNVLPYPGRPWAASSTEETTSRYESIASSKQWPSTPPEASETSPQTRWPSLPEEEATNQPGSRRDLSAWTSEMTRRSWERQQRLNEEQRGVSWNA